MLINGLIALADHLDGRGFHKEASEIDEIIKRRWEEAGNRAPEVNPVQRHVSWQDALNFLRASIFEAQKSGTLNLDQSTLQKFMDIITRTTALLEQQYTIGQKTSLQTNMESADKVYYVSPHAKTIAENMAALTDDINKSRAKIISAVGSIDEAYNRLYEGTLQDPDIAAILRGLRIDEEKLGQQILVLEAMATKEEKSAVYDFLNAMAAGKKHSVVLVPERRQQVERRQGSG